VATLARDLGIDAATLAAIAPSFPGVAADGATVRSEDHRPDTAAGEDPAWEDARRRLADAGAAPPAAGELGLDREALSALLRSRSLVGVGSEFAYLPQTIDEIVAATRALSDGFTVADFRDALGITRKHAIPLLEWLDEQGITRRDGDGRIVRR
jgi:selenocysteine-specific elongation factor